MRLQVPPQEAIQLLETIPHKTCRTAIQTRWHVGSNGHVAAQSALWLFCWAKTGMGSPEAESESRRIFNLHFPIAFENFDAQVPHEYARRNRYSPHDIEAEFAGMLAS